jgi:hypothetical protein
MPFVADVAETTNVRLSPEFDTDHTTLVEASLFEISAAVNVEASITSEKVMLKLIGTELVDAT